MLLITNDSLEGIIDLIKMSIIFYHNFVFNNTYKISKSTFLAQILQNVNIYCLTSNL